MSEAYKRRIYGIPGMFSCEIPFHSLERYKNYDIFIEWFDEHCEGKWSYPNTSVIKFTHEEDKVKFICLFPVDLKR